MPLDSTGSCVSYAHSIYLLHFYVLMKASLRTTYLQPIIHCLPYHASNCFVCFVRVAMTTA